MKLPFFFPLCRRWLPFLWLLVLVAISPEMAQAYDPLAEEQGATPQPVDLTVHDAQRNRDLPIRVYLPSDHSPQPVILFSPGLGGSREICAYLGNHWAARGYVAVFMQHPGSDDSVWKGKAPLQAMMAMKGAASPAEFSLRVRDVPVVIDQITAWDQAVSSPLFHRLDLSKIGMSGHSFGAVTTQAVSGQSYGLLGQHYTDPRIKAALAFSPSSPGLGASRAFSSVQIPWMLMTGTKDNSPIGRQDAASRLEVYPHLHGIPKYELVLNNAEHSDFTERPLPGDREPRNPNHHRVILALSTAYWDAYLRGDPQALAWLNGSGPRSVMETADQWQFDPGSAK
ncbi:MAG: dienelactone hydrolase [Chthoniobacteraceae bacterium]